MGLFGRTPSQDDSALSRDYVARSAGRVRKTSLGFACLSRIASLDSASTSQLGVPVADNFGLEPATAVVRDVLSQEASMAPWLARECVVVLDSAAPALASSLEDAMDVIMHGMGLGPGYNVSFPDLPPGVPDRVVGLASSVTHVWFAVAGSTESSTRAFYERLFRSEQPSTRAVCHDITAWASIAVARQFNAGRLPHLGPAIDPKNRDVPRLLSPGWYPNPTNSGGLIDGDARIQRYWSGSDWTTRARIREGRSYVEVDSPMTEPPKN